jgi:histidyl-tRNA synthetase
MKPLWRISKVVTIERYAMIKAQTLKGFRDFLPKEAGKRQNVIQTFRTVFERFGFDPLETPALEYAETLLGKYGNEADKLLYLFKDNGGRSIGLRYDQTVPLSRVITQYINEIPIPFKRYQMQPVWRAENTQKGRFREFLQCDIDTVGSDSPLADAEIIDCALSACKMLGFTGLSMMLNDRGIFDALKLTKKEIIIIDKLNKIGMDGVILQLEQSGRKDPKKLLGSLKSAKPTERLWKIFEALKRMGYKEEVDFCFDPFLARGLDYYTSTIFELKCKQYPTGSLAGGGRYDNLIGTFSGRDMPAVGIAFGFDRIIETMETLQLLKNPDSSTNILVTIFNSGQLGDTLSLAARLRTAGVNTEVYTDPDAKLDKQLKYADRKGIPYVIIRGPDESARNVVKLKNMTSKTQEELTIDTVIDKLTRAS